MKLKLPKEIKKRRPKFLDCKKIITQSNLKSKFTKLQFGRLKSEEKVVIEKKFSVMHFVESLEYERDIVEFFISEPDLFPSIGLFYREHNSSKFGNRAITD